MKLERVVTELRSEQQKLQKELKRVDAAISVLASLNGRGRGRVSKSRGVRPRRKLSPAARRRIAAAQKARWARIREQRQKRAA